MVIAERSGRERGDCSVVKPMCNAATASTQLNEIFNVKWAYASGSVLSPLFFTIVLEALSRKFKKGYHMSGYFQMI